MPNLQDSSKTPAPRSELPDAQGRFGRFGGRFVPETLMPAIHELEAAYAAAKVDPTFQAELDQLLQDYVGRQTPLYEAKRLSAHYGGARIFLKREDLAHTGSHKINNALGQALLARRMGKMRIVAETGAGQHGVATATACALLGMECVVCMGEVDIERQALNVTRMKLLGASVKPVSCGARTLKDAVSDAMRYWVTNLADTHYIIGSVVGPHPYPAMARDFQAVIGRETRAQIVEKTGKLPDVLLACVGGGSNAMGMFHPFIDEPGVRKIGVEAGGLGLDSGKHSACLGAGHDGVLHGALIRLLQDAWGQVLEAHSIAAGLDYPGTGPEHCHFQAAGLAEYASVTDQEALEAFKLLSRLEGIIPALESSHALAHLKHVAPRMPQDSIIVVCLSGRGDKDGSQTAALIEE
ncbi:tryptophan synthase, beta subunit [Desulfarculus baarsii DSM 2075]|uniref:Tryptophan synthase beta chain n=1 Tax=Desulfarculus baarsii (strain ATCC 33931 / DSM 2075 / LMG 7858 / VKM B-1802 / 2st14) TaxID=644282 RepID=E1QEL9_DESB2|nr:tryptophan synthase subunit beta [Desulfarculus baarsii]ADK84005.1 tryptophan synthase, beta subunit [Desulfarculus baarsii DSM 2075]